MRSLCEKHGIKVDRDEPLHCLYGKYVKKLKELNLIESAMTERILKSRISILDAFKDVRNSKSLARDNPVLNRKEGLLILQRVTTAIKFVWTLDQLIPGPKKEEVFYTFEEEDIPFRKGNCKGREASEGDGDQSPPQSAQPTGPHRDCAHSSGDDLHTAADAHVDYHRNMVAELSPLAE